MLSEMNTYKLTIYWWDGHLRSSGGEDVFTAADDAAAIAYARTTFDERVGLADQTEITDQTGRVVWSNVWPIPLEGRSEL